MHAMDRRNLQSQLPTGVKIYLPDEAARLRGLQERLLGVFRLWGYREVMTPTFEFFDVLALGTDEALQEGMFKFVDRDTGRMLALRADVTPADRAHRRHPAPRPAQAVPSGVPDERVPARGAAARPPCGSSTRPGVELLGLDQPEADAEMIAMTIEAFRAAGFERFQIDVGHVEFVRGVLDGLGVERGVARALRDGLGRKDVAELDAPGRGPGRAVRDGGPGAGAARSPGRRGRDPAGGGARPEPPVRARGGRARGGPPAALRLRPRRARSCSTSARSAGSTTTRA